MQRLTSLTLTAMTIVALLAGCGGSSSSSSSSHNSGSVGSATVSKSSFCADNAKLDKATASASTLKELVKALHDNQATIAGFAQSAPSVIKAKAEVLVAGATSAINSGSTTGFNQKFANAGKAVDSYCGEGASGNTSTGG